MGGRAAPAAPAKIALVIAALGLLGFGASASAARARSRDPQGGRGRIARPHSGVSLTRSARLPHWACPRSLCEAIVDPVAAVRGGRFALPDGGPQLEGSGELGGFSPADLQSAYRIPEGGAASQTVAVIDAFGYPAAESDLAAYRARYGLAPCTKDGGCLRELNHKGEEANYPPAGENSDQLGWEIESALDLDMVSAACPSCRVMLVESPDDGVLHLAQAAALAVSEGATEVSNSYGFPEQECAQLDGECEQIAGDYSHPGVVVTASAGDYRYDYSTLGFYEHSPGLPATLPSVIAVGGTTLRRVANARGWSETVWSEPGRELGTGSGCSISQPKPPWQHDAACATRMTNDVSADAACTTPVSVYATAEGGWTNLCGTSASAPLLAGIMAHAGEQVRFLAAQAFYEDPASLFDVLEGSNGTCTPPSQDAYFCLAQGGYDGPSGLGTPDELPLAPYPTVSKVEPDEGPSSGGTAVRITGFRLGQVTGVAFGAKPAHSFNIESETAIAAVAPPGAGSVDLTLSTPEGTAPTDPADRFTYLNAPPPTIAKISPKEGPAAGDAQVTITGAHFEAGSTVTFGGVEASAVTVDSASSITATSPPGTSGPVEVTVTSPAGVSAPGRRSRFKYGKPTVTGLGPGTGSSSGGTRVMISGSGFATGSATAISFGVSPATSVSCVSSSQCTATSPPKGRKNPVDVRAAIGRARSAKNAADRFSYE